VSTLPPDWGRASSPEITVRRGQRASYTSTTLSVGPAACDQSDYTAEPTTNGSTTGPSWDHEQYRDRLRQRDLSGLDLANKPDSHDDDPSRSPVGGAVRGPQEPSMASNKLRWLDSMGWTRFVPASVMSAGQPALKRRMAQFCQGARSVSAWDRVTVLLAVGIFLLGGLVMVILFGVLWAPAPAPVAVQPARASGIVEGQVPTTGLNAPSPPSVATSTRASEPTVRPPSTRPPPSRPQVRSSSVRIAHSQPPSPTLSAKDRERIAQQIAQDWVKSLSRHFPERDR
jgi:hypothetical protein